MKKGKQLIDKIPREDKINFLMKSNLFERSKLKELDERELNDFFRSGLEATGFKERKKLKRMI